ncbi:hypothetical protein BASA62_005048 [Batrachochytrium salamandrivorans]|nr:hypothetical protein BASA62_005048 [Batrachochytrium salamandrivorans]
MGVYRRRRLPGKLEQDSPARAILGSSSCNPLKMDSVMKKDEKKGEKKDEVEDEIQDTARRQRRSRLPRIHRLLHTPPLASLDDSQHNRPLLPTLLLESVFVGLAPDPMLAMKAASQAPIVPVSQASMEIGFDDMYPSGSLIDFPKRPPWSTTESQQELDTREHNYMESWLARIDSRPDAADLGYFERNIEVWRQLWRVVEISDVVLFIVDARHPILHFPPTLYDYIVHEMHRKLVLVLNKIDLVPKKIRSAWQLYFQNRYPEIKVVEFSCYSRDEFLEQDSGMSGSGKVFKRYRKRYAHAVGALQVIDACRSVKLEKEGVNVDWDALFCQMQADISDRDQRQLASRSRKNEAESFLGRSRRRQQAPVDDIGERHVYKMENYDTESSDDNDDNDDDDIDGEKYAQDGIDAIGISDDESPQHNLITIGLVGHPNVGKSSLINGVMGHKVVSTSKTPGHTKHFQTMHLTKFIRLCDCPGIVFPLKVPKPLQVQEPYSTVTFLAERINIPDILGLQVPADEATHANEMGRFGKLFSWSGWAICEAFALQRGFLTPRAARPDVYRAANMLLRMANDGRLRLIYRPPGFSLANGRDDADKDQCDLRNTDKRGVEARQNFEDEQHNVAKQYDGSTSGNGGSDGSDDDDDDGGGDYESNSHSIIKKNPFALLSDENE